eukprot:TRINITY_DN18_c0_g1_i2.p2 TRINITY_DN18_c0_g1~~TRINITY_DN18_c0_g1_i2.p2  ORF type:complete len:165 (+),score=77.48 TRINITY_DN18_c0_g1_i2:71-565(+)
MAAAAGQPQAQQVQHQQRVVDGVLSRISQHKGVLGLLVVNPRDGSLWKWLSPQQALDEKKSQLHAEKLWLFVTLTRSIVRTLDTQNDLTFLRVRGKKYEYIIAPERDFVLIVIQDYRIRLDEERVRKLAEREDKRRQAQQGKQRLQEEGADGQSTGGAAAYAES